MLIAEDPNVTVKCRTAIKALFLDMNVKQFIVNRKLLINR